MYELTCQYDSRASFYGKAKVEEIQEPGQYIQRLYSYDTHVASIVWDFKKGTRTYMYFGKYSQTTTRHQKEFFKQNGLDDKQIKEVFANDKLVRNV